MTRQALTSHDGELLLVPQRGTLDLQTELGYLRIPPGTIAVLPAGIRFSVALASFPPPPGGAAAGYMLELFGGARFRLPELAALGANALAHVRDFQYPVASFDLDFADPFRAATTATTTASSDDNHHHQEDWEVVVKLAGRFHAYKQPHTPFDVVAWHGRYAPYKYDLARFGHLTANRDQLDPTAYCVLTAASAQPGVSLVDFCVFGEKWAVARDTLRVPYHHRTVATELMGIVRGRYGGSVRPLEAGGLSFEQGFMGHGETFECWRTQGERELGPEVVGKDCLSEFDCPGFMEEEIALLMMTIFTGFMFHVPAHVALTKYATERHPDIRRASSPLILPFNDLANPLPSRRPNPLGLAPRSLHRQAKRGKPRPGTDAHFQRSRHPGRADGAGI